MKYSNRTLAVLSMALGFLFCCAQPLVAQINIGGKPYSFRNETAGQEFVPEIQMPPVNMAQIDKEDYADNQAGLPPRFGYAFPVDLNLGNAGAWTSLDNGDRIWRLSIASPGALSINLTYSAFWLPKGATLYLYDESKTRVIGGFTERNNNSPKGQSIGFATGFVFSDRITLEYYEPKAVAGQGEIAIDQVVHGYRTVKVPGAAEVFGGSGDCQVNVNCSPEGDNWQSVKNSVAMIVVGGNRWCTGSLLITTVQDFKPYFLTADHCLNGWAIPTPLDAVGNPMAGNWMFVWEYESADCDNGATEPTLISTTGAILVANNDDSDFALFRLIENPSQLSPSIPLWFNGWDATGGSGTTGGVGIHHPSGDIKKIATHGMDPVTTTQGGIPIPFGNYWEVFWDATTNGQSVTEGGSSGSPLLNNDQRVIGQLWGGSSVNCDDPDNDPGRYGKFSVSWDGANARRRLHDWLDPDCPVIVAINTDFTQGVEAFYASEEITTTSNISPNTLVDYSAGQRVRLLPGFHAEAGSIVSARIGGCDPMANRPADPALSSAMIGAGTCLLPGQNAGLERASRETYGKAQQDNGFECYPNPFSDGLYLSFEMDEPATMVSWSVADGYGRQVIQSNAPVLFDKGNHTVQINGAQLPAGIYYVTLGTSKGYWVQKVVKND